MKFEEKDRITLCQKCAHDFYDTDAFDIKRDVQSLDVGPCCYCSAPSGIDYFVKEKKQQTRQRKET